MNSFVIVFSILFAVTNAAPSGQYAAAYPHQPVAIPAPYTTTRQEGPGHTHIQQAPAQVSKQTHFGQTSYVANVHHEIIKPPTPHFPIAVSTLLKGSTRVNPTLTKTVIEKHVVRQPVHVERRIEVPYDVHVYEERIREIPQPYAVPKPYAVHVPTPVQGQPIVRVTQGHPIVHQTHTAVHAPQVYAAAAPQAYPAAASQVYAATAPQVYPAAASAFDPAYSPAAPAVGPGYVY